MSYLFSLMVENCQGEFVEPGSLKTPAFDPSIPHGRLSSGLTDRIDALVPFNQFQKPHYLIINGLVYVSRNPAHLPVLHQEKMFLLHGAFKLANDLQ